MGRVEDQAWWREGASATVTQLPANLRRHLTRAIRAVEGSQALSLPPWLGHFYPA